MIPLLIAGGFGAYLYKKFPKATTAVAKGVAKGTVNGVAWAGKKVVDHIDKKWLTPWYEYPCCMEYFETHRKANFCTHCGTQRHKDHIP